MYGYNQGSYGGYGSSYTNSAAVAAAAASAYGGLAQTPTTPQQNIQNSVFGSSTTSPYANYSNSVAAAYGYGQQQTTNAAATAASAYAQAAQQQASRLALDAYTAAAAAATPTQYQSFASGNSVGVGYGSNQTQPGSAVGFGRSSVGGASSVHAHGGHAPKPPIGAPSALGAGGSMSMGGNTQAGHNQHNKSNGPGSSNYTGYDAAVYAAASSYLQSKAAGTTNMWMSKKTGQGGRGGGGAGGGFGQRRFGGNNGNQGPARESQQFYCEICKISCAGQLTYKEHLEGQRHKKKEALSKGENNQSLPKSKVSFRCDLCNVTCTGQDTYNAHVRGAKHQKTLTLCKKLGKPIPASEPTIIPPSEMGGKVPPPASSGAPIPTVGNNNGAAKRVVGISTVNFVGGQKLSSTGQLEAKKQQVMAAVGSAGKDGTANAVNSQPQEVQALIAAEQNVKPVGEDFIEAQRDNTGKLLQYTCKLCDCKFSDPNAKEIHLKGRRHRLQYKLKVDPNLVVEMKTQSRSNGRNGRFGAAPLGAPMMGPRGPAGPMGPPVGRPAWFGGMGARGPWFGPGPVDGRRFETTDDRHVQAKHTSIYPDDEQLTVVEDLVTSIEKALKKVSDFFNDRDDKAAETPADGSGDVAMKETDRLLKGVMRVGILSKGLLLKDDKQVDLVVLCSEIPTKALLKEVAELLPKNYENTDGTPATLAVVSDEAAACLWLSREACDIKCRIVLTSRAFREEAQGEVAVSADSLNRDACLLALAHLRHAKWFQARCFYLQSCQITLRIMREIRGRLDAFKPLTDWMCELLVEKVLSSCLAPLSIGDAVRRVFEAVASGILSSVGPGLLDPCEKVRTDVLVGLTGQQREALMASAQHALRLIAFNQMYTVLGIDRLPDVRPPLMDRKRPMEVGSGAEEVKKDKKEASDEKKEENEEEKEVAVKMEVA